MGENLKSPPHFGYQEGVFLALDPGGSFVCRVKLYGPGSTGDTYQSAPLGDYQGMIQDGAL